MVRVFYNAENWKRLGRATEFGKPRGLTPTQVACAYALSRPFPSIALVGPANPEELRQSVAAADVRLSPEEREWLEGKHG